MGYVKISDLQQKTTGSLNGSEDMLVTSDNISYKLTVNSMSDYTKNKTIYESNPLYTNSNIINDITVPRLFVGGVRKDWTRGIGAFTGGIAIEITGLYNQANMNSMINVNILEVGDTKIAKCLNISGQWNNSRWDYGFAVDSCSKTEMKIRFARDVTNSKVYVVLGEIDTVWSDVRISIEIPLSSYVHGLNLGFDISTMSSFLGLTTDIYKSVDLKITKNIDILAGTGTKITYDSKGLVTNSTILSALDIPVLDTSKITTGILPVLRGGTGVTTSTGTGNNVLSTSATLVTPNIGVATGTSFNSITGLATVAPLIAGTATVGTSTLAARQDHIHPVQTSVTGNAGTATTLQTARTIEITGDLTYTSGSFNGSSNVTGIGTLANTGVNAGTYRSVTTDSKGRITAGTNPTTVSGYGLTDVYTKTEVNNSLALKINNSEKGAANGVSTLDVNGKVVLTQIPDSVLGQLEYMGTWNFATLPTATQKGQYWIASTSGNGYIVGDWAVWNGSSFDKVDNTDAVATVAGRTGNVVLTKSDVGLSSVDNTADNAKNVLSATKLATARNIALSGNVTGNVNFDGSTNVTITATVADDSHNHIISNVDGLQTALDGKLGVSSNAVSATVLQTARTIAISGGATGTATSFNGGANITIPITGLNASNLNTGTVPDARISGSYTGMTNLTGTGIVDFSKFLGNAADTVSAPSFSWTGDDNTGIYSPAADQLAITTGGVQRALFNSSGITGTLIGNASTATKLAAINTTFTGEYPVAFNVNGLIYSHTGITHTGTTNTLKVANVSATESVKLGNAQQASIQYNSTDNSIDFIIN